ncbi:hypothetical protein [Nocardia sp. NPDC049149]|uniref:hypothetical protein n=1 Tax=Nocardia sp. NPDC049149 TaxID=3364315 RepID=UPI0037244BD6
MSSSVGTGIEPVAGPSEENTDIPFTLSIDEPSPRAAVTEPDSPTVDVEVDTPVDHVPGIPAEAGRHVLHRIALAFADVAPEGWQQLDVLLVVTVADGMAQAYCIDAEGSSIELKVPDTVVAPAHEHRALTAELTGRTWWRMMLRFTDAGQLDVDLDYGDEPIPDEHRLAPESYSADLQVFPRDTLPIWLGAYLGPPGQQARPPRRALPDPGARRGVRALGLPALPLLWARWAVISAAFVAGRPEWGPRIMVSAGWFEGANGGSTVIVLPGGRAVLSGGTAHAPALHAAYNGRAEMPDLYAGAPDWVADPVLNARMARGMLSFCYWWEGDSWYRGDSPDADQIGAAIPGIWTAETVIEVVADVLSAPWPSVTALVHAAEQGTVTRDLLAEILPPDGSFDIGEVWYQLALAGVTDAQAASPGRPGVRA